MDAAQFFQTYEPDNPELKKSIADELSAALLAEKPEISPKYLYDQLGSRIFDAITELPEYYPTRTEAAIFSAQRAAFKARVPAGGAWVDLGAGSCAKAASLFEVWQPTYYAAVDISANYLREALSNLKRQHPEIEMSGVGLDFSNTLDLPIQVLQAIKKQKINVFYPGSSISNFSPSQALSFLKRMHSLCKLGQVGGGLLIGVDLVKSKEILEQAYDDPLGVTAAFNLNMLRNINALIGSNFDVRDWRHIAFYNEVQSRIEMHLEAKRDLQVTWGKQQRSFKQNERIHTENSYKWTIEQFATLLEQAGFKSIAPWTDEQQWFGVFWAST